MFFCSFTPVMKFFRNLGIKLLAALVVLSSLSWTVEEHYCMGRLVDMSVFGESHGCGMEMDDSLPGQGDDKQSSCCDEQTIVFDGHDQLKVQKVQLDFSPTVLNACWYYVYSSFLLTSPELISPIEYPPPPVRVKDIQLLDEVFLI